MAGAPGFMKTRIVKSKQLRDTGRLDAGYFLSTGVQAADRLDAARERGVEFRPLGGPEGMAEVWAPGGRPKRADAAPGEPWVPYLRPYDVFEYLPKPAHLVSVRRSENLDSHRLTSGTIVQTCSGRNLGPVTMVGDYLARFVTSNDMIRITVEDELLRFYLLAYLKTSTAQQLLRRDKTGSLIDHLSIPDVSAQMVPLLPEPQLLQVAEMMRRAVEQREQARLSLSREVSECESRCPCPERRTPMKRGWTLSALELRDRLDAAYYDPLVAEVRQALLDSGGVRVSDVAVVQKPGGRCKLTSNYVDAPYGRPFLSGGQLLEEHPINLRRILEGTFDDVKRYELRAGWIAYQADGRAEAALGTPVMITSDRDGWLASGHIGRLIPRSGTDAGWLYVAAATWQAQVQLKSKASGSVVDSTFEGDMGDVVLPPPGDVDGMGVRASWELFVEAKKNEEAAAETIEKVLTGERSD